MANPWWAFYGQKYKAKTGHLTLLQHGAYFTLLNNYYITGGPLPENTEHLTRLCGAHSIEEIEAISFVLSSFFSLRSDGWHNKKADAEIREAKRISKIRRDARLGKRKTIVNQVLPVCAPHTHTHTQKEEPKNKAASAFQIPDWLPKEEWLAFEEMRKKIRKPMTDKARSLIVTTLHKLRSHGHAPNLVLEQSIRNSWQDVYELRGPNGVSQQPVKESRARQIANNNAAAFAAVMGGAPLDVGSVKVQGIDSSGGITLEGEIKRLPE